MPLKLILVPKSSPDWGMDAERHRQRIVFGDAVTVDGMWGDLLIDIDEPNQDGYAHFLTSPTPELLAWAKEGKK